MLHIHVSDDYHWSYSAAPDESKTEAADNLPSLRRVNSGSAIVPLR